MSTNNNSLEQNNRYKILYIIQGNVYEHFEFINGYFDINQPVQIMIISN